MRVVGYRPYNVETYVRIVDREPQRSRSLLVTAASSSTTNPGLPPETMIEDTNIAISVGTFYPLQRQFRIMDCPNQYPFPRGRTTLLP